MVTLIVTVGIAQPVADVVLPSTPRRSRPTHAVLKRAETAQVFGFLLRCGQAGTLGLIEGSHAGHAECHDVVDLVRGLLFRDAEAPPCLDGDRVQRLLSEVGTKFRPRTRSK